MAMLIDAHLGLPPPKSCVLIVNITKGVRTFYAMEESITYK